MKARIIKPQNCLLPRRDRAGHKGDYGRLLLVAGSLGYTGAPVLAAQGALRTGAGLVFLGVPENVYPIVAVKCTCAMPFPLPEDCAALEKKAESCDAALIGPGLGQEEETRRMLLRFISRFAGPLVVDADGINALAGHIDILDGRQAPTVLTPHEGEFARLTGCALPVEDRKEAARAFAQAHRCVLVLKGSGTVTALPGGEVFVNATGNPGMASGGSGDVLAGMIAALLGQGFEAGWSAYTAVCLHGRAGDLAAQRLGEYAMTAQDLLDALPQAVKEAEVSQ